MPKRDIRKTTKLTTKQLQAIAILSAIPSDYKSLDEVAEKSGVCRTTLYKWMDDKVYADELEKQTQKNYQSFSSKIRNAHIKFALQGNAQLIKLFYQHAEDWEESNKIDHTSKGESIAGIISKAQQ